MEVRNYIYDKLSKSSKKRGRNDRKEISEEVNISTMDEEVFEEPDNFFEDENEEDVHRASTHHPIKYL